MRTNTFIKALAFAMLFATACNKNEIANDENADKKGYTIPVTVNVARQGDDPTKATFNDGTRKLSFSEGDKLFVKGKEEKYGGAGPFAGTLTYVSDGTFSGTIYSEGAYSGTAADLLGSAYTSVTATLLPAGYEGYGFLTVSGEGYSATLATVATKAFATTKAAGVEQLSLEQASVYSDGFALAPKNSILNFTINDLAKNTEVTVSYTDDKSNEISGSVTTDGDGTATFAIGVKDGTALHYCSLTVGGNLIALTAGFKTLVYGKIYNVTRSVAPATGHALSSAVFGDLICNDGLAYKGVDYNHLPDGVTARAKVCYVGGDGHGLALALTDEEGKMNQGTAKSTCSDKTPTVPGCTWKLPWLDDDMNNMITAAGGYVALRDGFSLVGGTNMLADTYWTREMDYYNISYGYAYDFNSGGSWMTKSSIAEYVRACLSW